MWPDVWILYAIATWFRWLAEADSGAARFLILLFGLGVLMLVWLPVYIVIYNNWQPRLFIQGGPVARRYEGRLAWVRGERKGIAWRLWGWYSPWAQRHPHLSRHDRPLAVALMVLGPIVGFLGGAFTTVAERLVFSVVARVLFWSGVFLIIAHWVGWGGFWRHRGDPYTSRWREPYSMSMGHRELDGMSDPKSMRTKTLYIRRGFFWQPSTPYVVAEPKIHSERGTATLTGSWQFKREHHPRTGVVFLRPHATAHRSVEDDIEGLTHLIDNQYIGAERFVTMACHADAEATREMLEDMSYDEPLIDVMEKVHEAK